MTRLGLRLVLTGLLTSLVGCGGCGGDDDVTVDGGPDAGTMADGGMVVPGDPGISATPEDGLETSEAGASAMFSVVLDAAPNADVTVPLTSGDETEGAVSPAELTFTPDNWDAPQMVTVTGVDDDDADGDVDYSVTVGPAASDDAEYDGLNGPSVSLTNIDDESAGITVSPTEGLETTEAGGTDEFTVVLNAEPSADVTIDLSSSDDTEGTVSPVSLTFTTENWNAPQTVTVTGVDDEDADGPQVFDVVTAAAVSDDAGYDGLDADDVEVTNLDDESAGISVTPVDGLMTTEAGGEATFSVVLLTMPSADVTIGLSSDDESEGTVAPASLVFTSENWNAPQTVTVTGVDDDAVDGNQLYNVLTAAAVSDDAEYDGVDAADVEITNVDDETAGVTVEPLDGLTTTEAGGTDTFTVVLNAMPSADVTLPLSASDDTEGSVSPASLTFTIDNWNAPQTVTLTGVDDDLADGDQPWMAVLGVATSTDASYDGVDPMDASVTNTDDETAGVTVGDVSGDTTEAGGTATFTVVLNSEPTADVTIPLSSSDTGEGTVAPAMLVFTPANWDAPQTVTLTGVDDDLVDGSQPWTAVLGAATSGSANYDGLDPADVDLLNVDDDSAGITVTPALGLSTDESGATDTFTVVLNSEPTANVTIPLSSSDPDEVTVAPAMLVFTPANWNAPQTVTVTGVDDPIADGNQVVSILTAAATSTDANYDGRDAANVEVTNIDNDSASISVTPVMGLMTGEDGSSATFEVVLNSQPSASVTLGLSSDDPSEGTVSPISVVFTTANWNAPQTVTVTGVDDDVADGNQVFSILTAAATSGDSDYDGLDAANVEVTNVDDDSPGITATISDAVSDEGGDTATVRVVLNSQPTDDVVLTPMSLDASEGTPAGPLTFTAANWDAPQTLVVTGVDDDVADGNQVYEIGYTVTSADMGYDGFVVPRSPLLNLDDDSPGVVVTVTDALSGEGGATAEISVVLQSEPTFDVTVDLSTTDATEGQPRRSSVTFTSLNWESPQLVLVDGVDDDVADGDQRYRIDWDVDSLDLGYDPFSGTSAELTNVDDDSPGVTTTIVDGTTTEAGGTATFEVELNSEPFQNVTITFGSDDTGEGVVTGGAMLTFTPANWNSAQTVTLTGVDDDLADGNQEYDVDWTVASMDMGYDGRSGSTGPFTNTDDDAPGITTEIVDALSGEDGATASFTIVLDSEPFSNVTIGFTSTDATEGAVPMPVTFTPGDWDVARTVTIDGVDDDVADGNPTYAMDYAVTMGDAGYMPLRGRVETFTNVDDDSAGVTVTAPDPTTGEAGATGQIAIVLTSEPVANVTLSLSSNRPDEGVPAVSSVMFTPGNWDTPQTVTINGVDDFVADGPQDFEVDWTVSSADGNYDPLNGSSPELTNADDDTAGFVLELLDDRTNESGSTGQFSVTLTSQPTSSVTLELMVTDPTEGEVIGDTTLVVSPATWSTSRLVRVGGVDDAIVDGTVFYDVVVTPSSGDAAYDALAAQSVELRNRDNDSSSVVVTPLDSVTDEAGDTAQFAVVLDAQPSADVTLTLSSSDPSEGLVTSGTALTFTMSDWDTPQLVDVTGQDDGANDGDVGYTIVTSVTSSGDSSFDGLTVDDVALTNIDDDSPGVRLSEDDLTTNEGGDTGTLRFRLLSMPTGSVTIDVISEDTTEGLVTANASMTFTTGNWDTFQTVTVTGRDDGIDDGDTIYRVSYTVTSSDGDYDGLVGDSILTNIDSGSCPSGSLAYLGYCWVEATSCSGSAAAVCASVGLTGSSGYQDLEWTPDVMAGITALKGCTNVGDNACCVESLWRNPSTNECFTHNFGPRFYNWPACLGSSPATVLCNPL